MEQANVPETDTARAKSAPGTGSITDVKLLAAQLFNETWRLLELQGRSEHDDDRMIYAAHASATTGPGALRRPGAPGPR